MSTKEKSEIIALVTGSELPCRRALAQLQLPRSTYYRWLKRQTEGRLEDRKGGLSLPWNKISPEEETRILTEARASSNTITTVVTTKGWAMSHPMMSIQANNMK